MHITSTKLALWNAGARWHSDTLWPNSLRTLRRKEKQEVRQSNERKHLVLVVNSDERLEVINLGDFSHFFNESPVIIK